MEIKSYSTTDGHCYNTDFCEGHIEPVKVVEKVVYRREPWIQISIRIC